MTRRTLIYSALGLLAVMTLFPLLYMVTNSFMGGAEYYRYYGNLPQGLSGRNPMHLIPEWITLDGYWEILFSRPQYLVKFWSSLFLSGTILAGQMVVAVLGGYAFARFRFPGRNAIFFLIILLMMMPLQVTLVPNYIVLEQLGLVGGYAAVILPGVFSAFGVFLMRQVMLTLPPEMFEAARLDGAGSWRALWRICLPNCKSGLAALAILSFADSWNMVEQPVVFLKDANMYPMSVFLTQVNAMRPEAGFACGLLSVAPALLLFLRFKDEMVMGIEYSAVK
ncbi:MAG: carbohydrate ABC transporter permease [Oscillospiraceae bacterium]|nr:carbohydrate ABC transporter permease [Oscillospiraceae bacterium]